MTSQQQNPATRRVEVVIVPMEQGRSNMGAAIVTSAGIIPGSGPSAAAAVERIVEQVRGRLLTDLSEHEGWDRSRPLRDALTWDVAVTIRDLERRGARARVRTFDEFLVHRPAEKQHWTGMIDELRHGLTQSWPVWTRSVV